MMRDVVAEEEKKKKETDDEDEDMTPDESEYETPQNGIGLGATTRPTPLGFPGLSAHGWRKRSNHQGVSD